MTDTFTALENEMSELMKECEAVANKNLSRFTSGAYATLHARLIRQTKIISEARENGIKTEHDAEEWIYRELGEHVITCGAFETRVSAYIAVYNGLDWDF